VCSSDLALAEDYRHVFFDCPPNLTLLSESVFAASDLILVPLIPTTLSIRTYAQLLDFFNEHDLDRTKIRAFFTMVEKRKSMHAEIIEEHQSTPGFLHQLIPNSAEVEKMGIYRAPLNAVRPGASAAKAYRLLWDEIASCSRER
jgi:cellulose biosynthesis protein BcsQ